MIKEKRGIKVLTEPFRREASLLQEGEKKELGGGVTAQQKEETGGAFVERTSPGISQAKKNLIPVNDACTD